MFRLAQIGTVLIALTVASLIVLAVRAAARRVDRSPEDRRQLSVRVASGLAGWLLLTAALAATGVLARFDARPPPMMLLLFGALASFAIATSNRTASRLVEAAPAHWPIAIQTMRLPIELVLWSLWIADELPVQMTFEGRNLDILVGLTAPLVAVGVARGRIGARGAIAWNLLSMGLLLNIMGIALTTMPGPLHLDWPGISNVVVTTPPFVWIPTLFVPVALFGHVVSLRQLTARRSPLAQLEGVR